MRPTKLTLTQGSRGRRSEVLMTQTSNQEVNRDFEDLVAQAFAD